MLKYTLAFVFQGDRVLMLRRNKAPNASLLNGVGGKIEPGETPYQGIVREVREEVGIDIPDLMFAGVVTWSGATETADGGMYVYFGTWPDGMPASIIGPQMNEGALDWIPINDVLTNLSGAVVDNIPYFLPHVLSVKSTGAQPLRFHCRYADRRLTGVEPLPLPAEALECGVDC